MLRYKKGNNTVATINRNDVATHCVLFMLIKTGVNKILQARNMSMNPDTIDTIICNSVISKAKEKIGGK